MEESNKIYAGDNIISYFTDNQGILHLCMLNKNEAADILTNKFYKVLFLEDGKKEICYKGGKYSLLRALPKINSANFGFKEKFVLADYLGLETNFYFGNGLTLDELKKANTLFNKINVLTQKRIEKTEKKEEIKAEKHRKKLNKALNKIFAQDSDLER